MLAPVIHEARSDSRKASCTDLVNRVPGRLGRGEGCAPAILGFAAVLIAAVAAVSRSLAAPPA